MNELRTIRAKSGTNQEGTSAHNRRVIIEAIRLNGPLSRADLSRATRLTKQTISNLVESLEVDGLVASEEVVRGGRGQPSTPYRLVPEGAFALGVQIDRHLTRLVAVDLMGREVARAVANLPPGGPVEGCKLILRLIETMRSDLAQRIPESTHRLAGLGLAMPGPFGLPPSEDNAWMMAPWQSFPLVETLAAGTGLATSLQNDATACATAERMNGSADGLDHAVCIYFGYGIGAGLILGGELYTGSNRNAGEIGMVLFSRGGSQSPLEHRSSLASLFQHLGLDSATTEAYAEVERRTLADDPRILDWLAGAAADMRQAVHTVETIFDPQTVILSGSAPEPLAKRLFDAMFPLISSNADRPDRTLPRLQLGMIGPWAVALGAAAEPIRRAFDPRFSAILKTAS
ncbi:ROK family transcriptional regulator [Shinella sp. 838]|jgi:predicted NBD/HSP70 family sugar kinase|uniref:ROK family transcriptional regulator n=1 Tax=unclassified Shinella TaxID=2643062 RepID=UPI0003C531B6|nr:MULTISPECIES: ROK family transcriptional regulator [unclassified Shinella]EYR78150.1 putative ROK family transcriptional regulator [Shinella sp. DD12]MDG4672683.1 ROK family transcriptional regulator [Shinella sp. 838]